MNEIGRKQPQAIAMVQAALIVEAGAAKRFDRLIMVTCKPEQRFQRWATLRKVDQSAAAREVTRRMATQIPDEEKIKLADYVIDNYGSLDNTQKQVQEVYEELRRQAEKS
jgi:dephospho-CoA kinase